ncbi:hypothetical protein PF005_g28093, partial [Phytophthora fragariae]
CASTNSASKTCIERLAISTQKSTMPVNSATATFTTSSGSEPEVVLAVAEVAVVSPSCWPWKTQMPSGAHARCPRSRRPPELVRSGTFSTVSLSTHHFALH